MKCKSLSAVLLLPLLFACNKNIQDGGPGILPSDGEGKHELRINLSDSATSTKAPKITNTDSLANVQFYVYDITDSQPDNPDYTAGPYGVLEFYAKVDGSTSSVSCKVTPGRKTIFALVNGKDYVPASLEKNFLKDFYSLPEDGEVKTVPMFGILADCDPADSDYEVSIPVKHLFSIVKIDKISFSPTDNILKETTMKSPRIDSMSLVNAGAGFDLFDIFQYGKVNTEHICNAPSDVFKANGKKYPCTFETGIDAAVDQNTYVYDKPHYFFCTPTKETGTQITVCVSYDGFDGVNYYNVNLGAIEQNKIYEISNLTIKGLGSGDPATILDRESLELSIEVEEYTVVSTEEEI